LIARAGGNPLFLQELVSSLADEGVLNRAGSRYRLARAMRPDKLPESVRSLLAERIDRLPTHEKDVLQSASVIGQTATLRLLARVADLPDQETATICQQLQTAGFLEVLSAPDATYAFRHALMCDAAYAGLLHQRRATMHGRIVTAMEELHADRIAEHVEELAGHAARARNWHKAADYAMRAGAKTAARDASTEAVRFYERALEYLENCEATPDRRDREIDLCLAIRDPLFRLGRLDEIEARLLQAEILARPLGDSSRLGLLYTLDSHLLILRGDVAASVHAYQEALRIAQQIGDRALAVRALFLKGFVLFTTGDFAGAVEPLREVRDHFADNPGETRHGLNRGIDVAALSYAVRAHAHLGHLAWAERDMAQMLALAEHHASPFEWAFACLAAGQVNELADKVDEAISWLERALMWCEQANARLLLITVSEHLGLAEVRAGKLNAGLTRLHRSLDQVEAMKFRHQLPFCLASLAEATLAAGDRSAAKGFAGRANSVGTELGDDAAVVRALLVLGNCSMHEGLKAPARAHIRSALAIAEKRRMQPLVDKCKAALAASSGRMPRKLADRSNRDARPGTRPRRVSVSAP
jgi:tetratricopeptide (TPR) repeat protein